MLHADYTLGFRTNLLLPPLLRIEFCPQTAVVLRLLAPRMSFSCNALPRPFIVVESLAVFLAEPLHIPIDDLALLGAYNVEQLTRSAAWWLGMSPSRVVQCT
jgi:hypothetical protein